MNNGHSLLRAFRTIGLILILGVSMSACATSTFTWKEEVQLHDGKKMIVERSNTYDSSMPHEIGQGAPLAEHKTTFTIPGTTQKVIWKSDYGTENERANLYLLALDFLDGLPYAATTPAFCHGYNKWKRPNPPYVFFKYVGEWKRISMEEFPEKLKINVTLDLNEPSKKKMTAENREYGFVRAKTVAEINHEPGMSKEYYSLLRTPLDSGDLCPPIYGGFKAPHPIPQPNKADDNK